MAVHADLLVDITAMLPRDERAHGGVVGGGRSGISCLSNMLSHPGEPAKSRQLHGR